MEPTISVMDKISMTLTKNDLFEFYKKYSNNLLNESNNYKNNEFDEHNFHFTNKTEFVKCNQFNLLLSKIPKQHLNGICVDSIRQTMYNYNKSKKDNEFEHIDWFYDGKYKIERNTVLDNKSDFIKFSNSVNELIRTYFPNISYTQIDKDDIDKLISIEPITPEKYLKYDELTNINKSFQLLLYRIQLLNQGVSAYVMMFFNFTELSISLSDNKIIIFNSNLNCISVVSYLECIVTFNDTSILFNIGKVILTSKIDKIDEFSYSIFELNFDFKITETPKKPILPIDKSNILRKSIVEYLSKIHEKAGSVNILQCLTETAPKSIDNLVTDKNFKMIPARSELGGTPISEAHTRINTTGFFRKDVTGEPPKHMFDKKSICYDKTTIPNYCTYNGLLNYYDNTPSVNYNNPLDILKQIYNFFEDFNNIASSLIIVTNIATIKKIFGNITEITDSLDFILFSSNEIMLYKLTGDEKKVYQEKKFIVDKKSNPNMLNLQNNIKPYQNIYIIVQGDYDEIMPAIFDPPISIDDINNKMQLFIDKFRELYKSSIPVIVTSYLSRAILTASFINLALPDVFLGWSKNNNINYTLQVFMLIYFIRNLKLSIHSSKVPLRHLKGKEIVGEGREFSKFMPDSRNLEKIGNLNISTSPGLKNVLIYVHSLIKKFVDNKKEKEEFIPDKEIKEYMRLYIKPIDYQNYFISDKLHPEQEKITSMGGFNNKLNKRKTRQSRKTRKTNRAHKTRKNKK
jgi:hypothetical protein